MRAIKPVAGAIDTNDATNPKFWTSDSMHQFQRCTGRELLTCLHSS
jgi:hypothetical protein